jgi:hypothetical protein
MNNFKFFRGYAYNNFLISNYSTNNNNFVDYYFQFDNDEPFRFGSGTGDFSLTLNPTYMATSNISFTLNNKSFTLIARNRQ